MSSRAEPTLVSAPGAPGRAERGAQRPARLARAPRRPGDPDLRLPAPPRPPVELPPGERRGAGAGGALLGPRRESPAGARVRRARGARPPARRDRDRARAAPRDRRAVPRPLPRRARSRAAARSPAASSATSPTMRCACGSGCRIGRPTISGCPSSAWPSWTPSSRSTIGATPCGSSPTPSSTRMAGPTPPRRAPASGSTRSSSGSGAPRPAEPAAVATDALAPVELDAGGLLRRRRARPGAHPSR